MGDRTYESWNDCALAFELNSVNNTQVIQVENPNNGLSYLLNEVCTIK